MNPSPLFNLAQLRHRRKRRVAAPEPTPPVALTLVSAAYTHTGSPFVVLEFDQGIDIAGLDGAAVVVIDNQFNSTIYDATGAASLLSPTTVQMFLTAIDTAVDIGVFLYTTGPSGIVGVAGAGTWVGVPDGLELPFP